VAQDAPDILACMSSLYLLEYKLLGLQLPRIWVISRCVYVMCGKGDVRVTWPRSPCVEGERDLAGKVLHLLANPSLCDVCTMNDLGAEGFAVQNVTLGK
jgi:hypothetical protein